MKIFTRGEIQDLFTKAADPALWTVVIPVAGKGTRLGYDKPKILYPIAGRTILDRLVSLLEPYCGRFIFVFSPENAPHVTPLLEEDARIAGRFEAPIIVGSRGMADSISQALPLIDTPYTLIIWGDQVAISKETIESVMRLHQFSQGAKLTLPLFQRENPYVHYEVDENGLLVRVLQKREGDTMPALGESDAGLFAVETQRLKEVYEQVVRDGFVPGNETGEWNFLPMLPLFVTTKEDMNGYRLDSFEETVGVNDSNDARLLEAYFHKCT
ncbi:MAG: NTP transferase domain-containing protein [Patescibacteria group bacterium]